MSSRCRFRGSLGQWWLASLGTCKHGAASILQAFMFNPHRLPRLPRLPHPHFHSLTPQYPPVQITNYTSFRGLIRGILFGNLARNRACYSSPIRNHRGSLLACYPCRSLHGISRHDQPKSRHRSRVRARLNQMSARPKNFENAGRLIQPAATLYHHDICTCRWFPHGKPGRIEHIY